MSTRTLHVRPPYRAEHIGSFLRPPALYEKRLLYEAKQCSREELRALEDEAIKDVVQMQQASGIQSITDGELRRGIFHEGVFTNLEGIKALIRPIEAFKATVSRAGSPFKILTISFQPYVPHVVTYIAHGVKESPTFFCDGKIKRTKPLYVNDFKYLKSLVAPEDVKNIKVTMGAPSWIHQSHGSFETYDLSVYANDGAVVPRNKSSLIKSNLPDEYFEDLGVAYRAEIKELYENGCRHIQIDNPSFCYFCSETMISGMEAEGTDHEALLDTYIRAQNLCTRDRPKDLTIGVHMCRGNYRGTHFVEGSYARVATKMFKDLDVDVFYLEYDNERSGDFLPLAHLPENKVAVLGLVTTKNPELETVSRLEARVNAAVDAIRTGNPNRTREQILNQLCISPQCGFASEWQGNPVTVDDECKKLALVVEAAKHIWGE